MIDFGDPVPRRDYDAVVPLINIVFLLLIFFLLAGTLGPLDPVAVDLPEGQMDDGSAGDAAVLYIAADGLVWQGEEAMDAARAADLMRDMDRVTIKADAAAPADALLTLMERLRDAGIEEVMLGTEPGRG